MKNSRLRFFPIDSVVFLLLVAEFRNPFDKQDRRAKTQEVQESWRRLRREFLEIVDFDEDALDLAFDRSGSVSNRSSAERLNISASQASRKGRRAYFLLETGTLAKVIIALLQREGDAVVRPGKPLHILESRDATYLVPLSNTSRQSLKSTTWRTVAKFIRKHWDKIRSSDSDDEGVDSTLIAVWKSDDGLKVHIAGAVESREDAIALAKERGVSELYDWANRTPIQI
ncbi:MAG: hypothetical protein KDA80_11500 [Planctomycetaceae bacterium]|nr:hypothetical protein [Planctomycetaceae bacterium]